MKLQILQIDSKFRITVPSEVLPNFTDRRVYGSFLVNSLLVGNLPYEGEGVFSGEIDAANRVMIGRDTLELIGVGKSSKPEERAVIWIPCIGAKREVEFLLLFGTAGRETWKRLLESKTLIRNTLYTRANPSVR